jgi:hypothetical protein
LERLLQLRLGRLQFRERRGARARRLEPLTQQRHALADRVEPARVRPQPDDRLGHPVEAVGCRFGWCGECARRGRRRLLLVLQLPQHLEELAGNLSRLIVGAEFYGNVRNGHVSRRR